VKILAPGSHFGCDHMLGIAKNYCGSLTVMTMCHMLAISRASYLLALEQYPAKEAANALLRSQRASCKELREAVERTAVRKVIWQRYQGQMGGLGDHPDELSDEDLLRRVSSAWSEVVKMLRQKRQLTLDQTRRRDDRIAEWMKKNDNGRRKVEHKKRLKDLIQTNISERGPLRYLDEADPPMVSELKPNRLAAPPRVADEDSKELVSMLKAWPTPRQSPHYKLKVWSVVGKELLSEQSGQRPGAISRLLPLVTGSRNNSVTPGLFTGLFSPSPPPLCVEEVAGNQVQQELATSGRPRAPSQLLPTSPSTPRTPRSALTADLRPGTEPGPPAKGRVKALLAAVQVVQQAGDLSGATSDPRASPEVPSSGLIPKRRGTL
ncbi:unnamed protein product, partial [Polarella glacialis]